ncbi:hypothetical protein EVAR_16367_1 [Eumeta japonica]|uniref:Uncharacterized protein n=1 Tax=Eumeta variegata TaxID=151549 RepID=A0A4C1VU71_EUMVA|nr:hypothetical protein EVAR_16367_1 [Eumeta japonica]
MSEIVFTHDGINAPDEVCRPRARRRGGRVYFEKRRRISTLVIDVCLRSCDLDSKKKKPVQPALLSREINQARIRSGETLSRP